MEIKDFVDKKMDKFLDFLENFKKIKSYKLVPNILTYIISFIMIFTLFNIVNLLFTFILSASSVMILSFFNKSLIKSVTSLNLGYIVIFNKKEKKELNKKYNELDDFIKSELSYGIYYEKYINKLEKKAKIAEYYIRDNNNLDYKEIIIYINDEISIDYQNNLIKELFYKLKKDSLKDFLERKNEILDFIYNSEIRKELKKLSMIELKIISEETIDNEIKEIYKIAKKINLEKNIIEL
jgi:hypothetical protein